MTTRPAQWPSIDLGVGGRHRPGVEVPLGHLAAEGTEAPGLRGGLDALGHQVVAEGARPCR